MEPHTPSTHQTQYDTPSAATALLHPGAEPVAGYRLTHRLGRGGFGEVWRATGPGGVPVALKFVPLDAGVATKEVRALEFMKEVKHPHLLTIFGIWYQDNLLMIGMELAERTLLDCLQAVVHGGATGIPLAELLAYLEDAAEGIDFLNEPRHTLDGTAGRSILHRDIKPHNLLLLGGGVKVSDFGLARVLERSLPQRTGGMTPAYAPPEFFEGRPARQSDQYSLAVSYCQLRGGALPFDGTMHEVMAGHLSRSPNLSMVPEAEQPAVARALAKSPEGRWPDCRTFVRELGRCQGIGAATDLTGEWVLTEVYDHGATQGQVKLTQEGCRLTGTLYLIDHNSYGVIHLEMSLSGLVDGDNVSFSALDVRYVKGVAEAYYLDNWFGVLRDRNTIAGTSRDDAGVTGKFEMRRTK